MTTKIWQVEYRLGITAGYPEVDLVRCRPVRIAADTAVAAIAKAHAVAEEKGAKSEEVEIISVILLAETDE